MFSQAPRARNVADLRNAGHVLIEATGDGHCALPVGLLKDEAGKLLLVDDKIVSQALARTLASNEANPLDCDLLVVDETSMVDACSCRSY